MDKAQQNKEIFISKSFLMKAAKHRVETIDDGKFTSGVNSALEPLENIIENAHPADTATIIHAKWIICSDGYYPYCSNCKREPQGRTMTKFCPNCGATMDRNEED